MDIRKERKEDIALIRRVTEAAFAVAVHSSGTEGAIIDGLRESGRLTLSLVAVADGSIIGHAAFSPVLIAGRDQGWFGLGPVSVLPGRQRLGIGQALIGEGLQRLKALQAKGCVVLGDPAYYGRFGFAADDRMRFAGVPPEYFLRLAFTAGVPSGEVTYAPPFYAA
ncbi:GNAT family N-acetyltransferase [Leisingera sp. ANG59]|uniref:GNAT family N-acetyltransferase n=1 Tax=Leisingera sp. ANG59 TaxID=2675221 RepID=UPI00157237A8|nr:N-acetyltransferase [Leisingera sp. ANG59]NSY40058.1 GNAT family N-acetyltransferase [Leisingera sp. ANG59]